MLEKTKDAISKSIIHLDVEFGKLQLWRANPASVESIMVEQYGSMQSIQNVANVSNLDWQTLSIKPWDKTIIHSIAKAISNSWMWLNPQTMADSVLIKFPPLTEERRREVSKIAKNLAEEAKIAVRNARWDTQKLIKKSKEDKEISEDIEKKYLDDLQKLVDDANKKIDEKYKNKDAEIMKI